MTLRFASTAIWALLFALPAGAAELAYPNGIEEGFSLWSSSAEYKALWNADPPRNPWLMADTVASTYDVGTRALRAGDGERAYRLWLSLAQSGNCRAKFAVGYLLDPASPAALATVTSTGHVTSAEERAAIAFAWYLSAAEEGWPAAQRHVGDAYAAGRAVPADPEAAKLWYRRAARAMDPDAMLALATMLLQSNSEAERTEGLTWAFIARYSQFLFWFDDRKIEPIIRSLRQSLSADDIAMAEATYRYWSPMEWLIHTGIDEDIQRRRTASRRMFVDLARIDRSPAAAFDSGALAAMEGRHQDAFDAWWPQARQGHCRAQLAVGILGYGSSEDEIQPFHFPGYGQFHGSDAADTALFHAAMQGLPEAQHRVLVATANPDVGISTVGEATSRWYRRGAEQGDLLQLRDLLEPYAPRYGGEPATCFYFTRLFRRSGIDLYAGLLEECRSMLSPAEAAMLERQALEWLPETP